MEQYILPWLVPAIWILICSYALFTFGLAFLWSKLPSPNRQPAKSGEMISVVIPVRNEQENILFLLKDLENQSLSYPQFEVLVMNDNSTDNTAALVLNFINKTKCNIRLIHLPDVTTASPKKRAIETAVAESKGNLIVSTDGDCRVGSHWLQSIAEYYSKTKAKLISGPVTFTKEKSLTDHLQTVEFASLIGSGASSISAGYPSMCNGANLTYEKSVFYEVGGFDGVRHIASGDDEFLMHKIAAKYPNDVHFLKNPQTIVSTKAHQKLSLFFRQRKRWASKWKHYQSKTPLVLALYIFSCNFSLIASTVLFLTGNIDLSELGIIWLVKCAPEWLFLGGVLSFLQKPKSIFFIPITQIIYPFYVCFFGLAAQKPEYEWKGRKLV